MGVETTFKELWTSVDDFKFKGPVKPPDECKYALEFEKWTKTLITNDKEITITQVQQAKVLLVDRYFEWRRYVPKTHRNRVGERGHTCIYHVFEQTHDRLKSIELSLTPKTEFFPQDPMIGGLFLGELKKDKPR